MDWFAWKTMQVLAEYRRRKPHMVESGVVNPTPSASAGGWSGSGTSNVVSTGGAGVAAP